MPSLASSILPIEPPLASTLNPSSLQRPDSHVCSRHCHSMPPSTALMLYLLCRHHHPYPITPDENPPPSESPYGAKGVCRRGGRSAARWWAPRNSTAPWAKS